MEKTIFISYATPDLQVVRALAHFLRSAGFKTWFDKESLHAGEDWRLVIKREIANASLVLICLSPQSVSRKGFFQNEMKLALDTAQSYPEGTVYIMPIRLAPCEIPVSIERLHVVDAFREDGTVQLLKSISKALGERAQTDDEQHSITRKGTRRIY